MVNANQMKRVFDDLLAAFEFPPPQHPDEERDRARRLETAEQIVGEWEDEALTRQFQKLADRCIRGRFVPPANGCKRTILEPADDDSPTEPPLAPPFVMTVPSDSKPTESDSEAS